MRANVRALVSARIHPLLLLVVTFSALCVVPGCSDNKDDSSLTDNQQSASVSDRQPKDDTDLSRLLEVSRPGDRDTAQGPMPAFRDVAESVGVVFQHFGDAVPDRYFLPEVMGGGVAWIDIDCDGDLDLYVANGCELWEFDPLQTQHVNRMFRNLGNGTFTDVTLASQSGDNRYGQGCTVGDFNADGFPDLHVTNYGRDTLFMANGDGTYEDVTVSAGVGNEAWGTSAVWFDANGDGLNDLYVANYLDVTRENHQVCTYDGVVGYCGPGRWDGVADILYMNTGDGHFTATSPAADIDTTLAQGLAVAVCDFDGDQRPEIYVANDMAPNFLLTRADQSESGPAPLFRDVGESSGCAVSGDGLNEASMGIACADFDADGLVDIFLTHYYQHKNTLYRNLGSLIFEDSSQRSRVAASSYQTLGFGTVALDAEHDGDEDLFIANGHVLGPKHTPNGMKPQFLLGSGQGDFDDVSARMGGYFEQLAIGRGCARGDFNNDGRVDIAVTHLDRPLAILQNETTATGHFLGLELLPRNRVFPAGGQVIVTTGDHTRTVPIVAGGSYLSSGDPRLVVGLGNQTGPVRVEVIWPEREPQTFEGLTTDTYWKLREGFERAISSRTNSQTGGIAHQESPTN